MKSLYNYTYKRQTERSLYCLFVLKRNHNYDDDAADVDGDDDDDDDDDDYDDDYDDDDDSYD